VRITAKIGEILKEFAAFLRSFRVRPPSPAMMLPQCSAPHAAPAGNE
jgi:hypothetical protein